jgi:hypothetical protein
MQIFLIFNYVIFLPAPKTIKHIKLTDRPSPVPTIYSTSKLLNNSTPQQFNNSTFFRIFAKQTHLGLIWIRQQVLWECKHVERCEAGSLIPNTKPINGNDYNYAMAA